MEQRPMVFVRPMFLLSAFLVTFSGAQHIYQSQNEWSRNDCGNIHQILRDIKNDIDQLTNTVGQIRKNSQQGLGASFCIMYYVCPVFQLFMKI